jgi:hypothetical protein
MSTTVPTVKATLLALFKAVVDDSTEVWPNRPNEDHQLDENVYIGKVVGSRKFVTFPASAPKSRQENYEVLVEVEVFREGSDGPGTEARMWEIVEACEAQVAAQPTLESLTGWALSDRFDASTLPANDGMLAKYTFGVAVTARI